MKSADIEIGGHYCIRRWGHVRKVEALEKGLRPYSYSHQRNGVRVKVLDGGTIEGKPLLMTSRDIEPWDEGAQERLDEQKALELHEQRVVRVAERMGVDARAGGGIRVIVHQDDFFKLAERLGVDAS